MSEKMSASAEYVIEFVPDQEFEAELIKREYLKMISDIYGDRDPEEKLH